MPTHLITLTFQECRSRYGLDANDLRTFVDYGLLDAAPAPDTVVVEEPDVLLPRLARLHHELGLSPEAVDIILAMRRRLEHLQTALRYETARNRQLEDFVRGNGQVVEW